MPNRTLISGLVVLAAGLLIGSFSSLLGHFGLLGTATDFARGVLDGLSVIAFAVAIWLLVRSSRPAQD
jgi:hypothetical protein